MTQVHGSIYDHLMDGYFGAPAIKKTERLPERTPFLEWIKKSNLLVGRVPFTFQRHEYLRVPYQDDHPFIIEQKAVQMGLTTKALLRVIHKAIFKTYEGVLYFFPSRSDVSDLSRARFTPLVKNNPEAIGNWVADTDQTNLKMIADTPVYFRGMKSDIALQSAPGNFIIFDEMDLASQAMVDTALDRLDHAEDGGEIMMLSKPSLPDYGIAKAFLETDQRYWLLKCPGCNEYHNLVEEFPNCFVEKRSGEAIRACVKCGKELNPVDGEWVAKKPSITDKRGYQYSQLYSQFPRANPSVLLQKYKSGQHMRNFYNQKIGIPFIEAENRLSEEEVFDLCGDYGIASSDPGPCSMGVDQGKYLHVVIGKKDENYAGKILYLSIHKEWEELDSLMRNFNITRCVVDKLPETRPARAFAQRFPRKVFMNTYNEYQRTNYKWDEENYTVSSNRTESLDASHNEIQMRDVLLPRRCDTVEVFARHLHNVGKKLIEDEEKDTKRYSYVKLGEDHFRHAYNYEAMARQYSSDLAFPWLQ